MDSLAVSPSSELSSDDASLAASIGDLSIRLPPQSCKPDSYLTKAAIQTAFNTFIRNIEIMIQFVDKPQMAEHFSGTLFSDIFSSFCTPYREVLRDQKWEHEKEIMKLQAEKDKEITNIKTEKDKEITKLQAEKEREITNKDKEITKLQAEKEREIMKLQAEKEREIMKIQAEKERDVTSIQTEKDKEIMEKESIQKVQGVELELERKYYKALMERFSKPRVSHIGVPASVNRRQTWETVMNDSRTSLNVSLPEFGDASTTDITDISVNDVVVGPPWDPKLEVPMYQPVLACLALHLTTPRSGEHPGSKVFDTTKKKYLEGYAPDFSITVQGVAQVDSASVIAIIELKTQGEDPLTSESHGQVYDYLIKLAHAQPNRRKFVALLSNLKENRIITYQRMPDGTPRTVHHRSVSFAKALNYLKHCILSEHAVLASIPTFPADLGVMERRLGDPFFSVIGVFPVPEGFGEEAFSKGRFICADLQQDTENIVVKRTVLAQRDYNRIRGSASEGPTTKVPGRPVGNEIKFLELIRKEGGHHHLPQILYYSLKMDEFAILPLGVPFDLYNADQFESRTILKHVLSALKWIHERGIIHRDVRWDNIIWDKDRGVLIDFGAAVEYNREEAYYEGGYICCPLEVIGKFKDPYVPEPADDCKAFLLLVNALLSPRSRWASMRTDKLADPYSEESKRMKILWSEMAKSRFWSPYLEAAKAAKYTLLEELLEIIVFL